MKTSTAVITLASLLTCALARPAVSTRQAATAIWKVSGFTNTCDPAACTYQFNIEFAGSDNEPAFKTSCTGTNQATDFAECDDRDVLAQETTGSGEFTLNVRHVFTGSIGEVTDVLAEVVGVTTQNDAAGAPPAFDIIPDSVSFTPPS